MENLRLQLSSPELARIGKINLIRQFLARCSGKRTTYSCSVNAASLVVSPPFETIEAFDRVHNGIAAILNNRCQEMDSKGECCYEHYNCCDCGGSECGCRYCFSCNACSHCLDGYKETK